MGIWAVIISNTCVLIIISNKCVFIYFLYFNFSILTYDTTTPLRVETSGLRYAAIENNPVDPQGDRWWPWNIKNVTNYLSLIQFYESQEQQNSIPLSCLTYFHIWFSSNYRLNIHTLLQLLRPHRNVCERFYNFCLKYTKLLLVIF